jgi:hypothetical protein
MYGKAQKNLVSAKIPELLQSRTIINYLTAFCYVVNPAYVCGYIETT